MSCPVYAIYGASGCGRSLMPVARQQLQRLGISAEIYFIDDSLQEQQIVNGHIALNYQSFKNLNAAQKFVLIAIANSQIREKLANQLIMDGLQLWTVQADNVVMMDNIEIDDGAALSPFVSITSNIKIGKCFHANLYSYVEHDCVIGDYVTEINVTSPTCFVEITEQTGFDVAQRFAEAVEQATGRA